MHEQPYSCSNFGLQFFRNWSWYYGNHYICEQNSPCDVVNYSIIPERNQHTKLSFYLSPSHTQWKHQYSSVQFSSVQLFSLFWLFATPWTAELKSWHLVSSLHGKQMGKQWKQCQTLFLGGSKITSDGDCRHEIKPGSIILPFQQQ